MILGKYKGNLKTILSRIILIGRYVETFCIGNMNLFPKKLFVTCRLLLIKITGIYSSRHCVRGRNTPFTLRPRDNLESLNLMCMFFDFGIYRANSHRQRSLVEGASAVVGDCFNHCTIVTL